MSEKHDFGSEIEQGKERHKKPHCFIVYSSREPNVQLAVDSIADQLQNEMGFWVIKFDEQRRPGEQLLEDILTFTKECDLGVVILDGLRPNVILELGMLIANGVPRIILLNSKARVDVSSLATDAGIRIRIDRDIPIDVSKQISDISNINWDRYDLTNPAKISILIRQRVATLRSQIDAKRRLRQHHAVHSSPALNNLYRKLDAAEKSSKAKHADVVRTLVRELRNVSGAEKSHACLHIAQSFRLRGELHEALAYAVKGLSVNPKDLELIRERAILLHRQGHSDEAVKILRSASTGPTQAKELVSSYLWIMIESGKAAKAIREIDRIGYEKLVLNGWLGLKAEALLRLGQYDAGMTILLDMYEHNSDQRALGKALYFASQYHDSVRSIKIQTVKRIEKIVLAAIAKKHIACPNCLVSTAGSFNLTKLIELIASGKAGLSDSIQNMFANQLAFMSLEKGEPDKALFYLRSILRKDSRHCYANATMGLYKFHVERKLKAGDEWYKRAIRIDPRDLLLQRMYHYQRGCFFIRKNDRKHAEMEFVLAEGVAAGTYYVREIRTQLNKLKRSL